MAHIISGIQQIGIGVLNAKNAFIWYRKILGFDVLLFDDVANATLMKQYTGGEVANRHALLALNLKGGGGIEIWQFKNRNPVPSHSPIQIGDTGIFSVKIKSQNIYNSYAILKSEGVNMLTGITKSPEGTNHFYIQDPYKNIFEIIESTDWFTQSDFHLGGVAGCQIGVTNIEEAKNFYHQILGYDTVVYDVQKQFKDLQQLPGGENSVRRMLIRHSKERIGSFSKLLGFSEIELIQVVDRKAKKIYANRCWGDLGFIHICFDINGMDSLKKRCEEVGYPFTVDSASSFGMGDAAGHFSYVEDSDGTLVEFVETHKIPVLKKLGWYLDLRKRNPQKALPSWMLKALRFNRVKD